MGYIKQKNHIKGFNDGYSKACKRYKYVHIAVVCIVCTSQCESP